jgi:hypothetical protein
LNLGGIPRLSSAFIALFSAHKLIVLDKSSSNVFAKFSPKSWLFFSVASFSFRALNLLSSVAFLLASLSLSFLDAVLALFAELILSLLL